MTYCWVNKSHKLLFLNLWCSALARTPNIPGLYVLKVSVFKKYYLFIFYKFLFYTFRSVSFTLSILFSEDCCKMSYFVISEKTQ